MPKVQTAARMMTEAAENGGPMTFARIGHDAGDQSAPRQRVRHLAQAASLGEAKAQEDN